jgi:hypothetical protein
MKLFSRHNGTEFEMVATHVLTINTGIFGLQEQEIHHHIKSTNTFEVLEIQDSHLKQITITMKEAGHI